IYAAVNHHLKDIPLEDVKKFEVGFYEFMATQHPAVGKTIVETGELSKEAEEELIKGIEEYKREF
ncbi:MAG: F0F1 ATP synthase subunit alpha, partial [Eubacterium sp.]|nr:F0F1 ATP synthase subunit alpha [Candidatus Colimonas fimequi]